MWAAGFVLIVAFCSRGKEAPRRTPAPPAESEAEKAAGELAEMIKKGVEDSVQHEDVDDRMQSQVEERLAGSRVTQEHDIDVKVHERVVTLQGEVPDQSIALVAEALAETVPGVERIENEIKAPVATAKSGARGKTMMPPPGAPPMTAPEAPAPPGARPVLPDSPEGQAIAELLKKARKAVAENRPEEAMQHYGAVMSIDHTNEEARNGLQRAALGMTGDWMRRFGWDQQPRERRSGRRSAPPAPTEQPEQPEPPER
jgi:hypothetical protein